MKEEDYRQLRLLPQKFADVDNDFSKKKGYAEERFSGVLIGDRRISNAHYQVLAREFGKKRLDHIISSAKDVRFKDSSQALRWVISKILEERNGCYS